MGETAIYVLRLDGRIRYVGQSTKPKQRLAQHVANARCYGGPTPVMEILRWVPSETADTEERLEIRRQREAGEAVTNVVEPAIRRRPVAFDVIPKSTVFERCYAKATRKRP